MFERFILRRTRHKDARQAREDAAREGRAHGRRDFPRPASPGAIVDDHFAAAQWAEADAAATLAMADHLARRRPRDDAAVDRAAGAVLRRTAETADARQQLTGTLHRLARVEARSTLARWERPWPPWLRVGLIALMAVGSVANLAAGLLGVTADDPGYALGYSLAIGTGLVGLGAVIGQMLKRWELNRLQAHEHVATRSRVPAAVVALGLAAALALVVAVGSIRSTAAELEARRLEDAGRAAVQVFGGAAEAPGPGPALSIPALTWALLEAVLVASALLVEYAGSMPWARVRSSLQRHVRRQRRRWLARRRRLARAWAALRSACNGRAAHDAAVLVAGEATLLHADVETSTYRYENLASRPRPELLGETLPAEPTVGAPLRFEIDSPPDTPIADVVTVRWGLDLRRLGGIGPDFGSDAGELVPGDGSSPPGDVHRILADAQLELQRAADDLDADQLGGPLEPVVKPPIEMSAHPRLRPNGRSGNGSSSRSEPGAVS